MDTKKLKVGAFQFSTCGDIGKNLEALKRGIRLAAAENVRLLLTHECALCGYPPFEILSAHSIDQAAQNKAVEEISALANQYRMHIALGMITFQDGHAYNTVQLIGPGDTEYEPYHKRALWGWDKNNFAPGNGIGVCTMDGIKIGIRICYDIRFPEYFRELFRNKVDLCLVSFHDTGDPDQRDRINIIQSHLVSRAAENVMYVLSANTIAQYQTAPTCLINPDGVILETAPLHEEALICREIEFPSSPTFSQEGRISHAQRLLGMEEELEP